MRTRFTTIRDVVEHMYVLDPALYTELGEERVEEIVRREVSRRYEELGEEDVAHILAALYRAAGV